MEKKRNNSRKAESGGKKKPPLYFRILRGLYVFFTTLWSHIEDVIAFLYVKGRRLFRRIKKAVLEKWHQSRKERAQRKIQRKEEKTERAIQKKEQKILEKEKRELAAMQKAERLRAHDPVLEEVQRQKRLQQKRKRDRRIGRAVLVLLSVVLAAQLLMLALAGVLYVKTGVSLNFGKIELLLEEGKTKKTVSISVENGYDANGQPMVDMSALASWLGFHTISDGTNVYYILSNGARIVLEQESRVAHLGGSLVMLSAPVRFAGERVYVPLELITDYTTGLGVSYSEKEKRLTLSRQKDEEKSNATVTVYKELVLTAAAIEAAPLPVWIMWQQDGAETRN